MIAQYLKDYFFTGIIYLIFLFPIIYLAMRELGFWGINYNNEKRRKTFEDISESNDKILFSNEVNQLIPEKIYRKTYWFRKYGGKGWLAFVLKFDYSEFSEILLCDFGNIFLTTSKCGASTFHITILIIKQQIANNEKIKKKILSKKFYSIYRKRSNAKIETIKNYTFICFDAPLNLESLKILKQCAIEQN